MAIKQCRIGETKQNNSNINMKIIEYNNYDDITVEFEDGFITRSNYGHFKTGNIKSLYTRSILNIGYVGDGNYKVSIDGIHTIEYEHWFRMINRCYNRKLHMKRPTYKDCTVCDEWHNYQTFAKWFNENYYTVDNETMHLDKDILVKGNKIYSPQTCIFVPERINSLFCKRQNDRGEYVIGVNYQKRDNMFQSRCNDENNKSKYLGYFNTEIEAFESYKTNKEIVTKKVADSYKNKIPCNLYNAMYKYQVEITD